MFPCIGAPTVNPIVIAIWCGRGKPKELHEFLSPLVNEINKIMQDGVIVNDCRIDIADICFIADGPARAQLKGIVSIVNLTERILIAKNLTNSKKL